ncbi:MAG: carboxypeptidase-like regulatory domain-containing protein [Mangrovibacterium sp.]
MKTLFLSAVLFFAGIAANASEVNNEKKETAKADVTELSGVVLDQETNEALVGVKVELEGTGKVVYTDFDGNYTFKNVEPGNYDVVASFVSYESAKESVNLEAGVSKSINLKAAL